MAFPLLVSCSGHDPARWRLVEPVDAVVQAPAAAAPARAVTPPAAPSALAPAPARDEAAELAARLGLGTRDALVALMRYGTPREWVDEVGGQPASDFAWPVDGGELFRGFGYNRRQHQELLHKGIDIGAPEGTPVAAVADGIVGFVGEQPGYGTTVVMFDGRGAVTLFAHLRSTSVVVGQRVRAGQQVGAVGVTGITLCPHLHFELRVHGTPRDPLPAFRRALLAIG